MIAKAETKSIFQEARPAAPGEGPVTGVSMAARPRSQIKVKVIGYWICTVLIVLSFASGGVAQLLRVPETVEGIIHLGYPLHFLTILGTWKLLGAAAVLVPGLPRVKEWAYAGMIFDLTGATAAHVATGDDLRHILTPLVIAAFVVASWALRPEGRRLQRD